MDVRTQEYTMSSVSGEGAMYRDDSITAPTADGQRVSVDATIWFHVDAKNAHRLYQTVGTDYLDKIMRPSVRSEIRFAAHTGGLALLP